MTPSSAPQPLPPLEDPPAPAAGPSPSGELRQLWGARGLLWAFVRNDLRVRYLGSSIGFFWTVINPVLELVTYTFVFNVLLDVKFHPTQKTADYVLFLFSGMVAWNAFADGLVRATTSVTNHAHLLRKLNFPAVVLPTHLVASAVVNQAFRLVILALACLIFGHGLSWHVLLLPLFVVLQALFTTGLGLLLATLNVYFRDMSHWVNAALMIGMFVTPVFYAASAYPRKFVLLLYPNPMAQFIGIYQGLLLNHQLPSALSSVVYVILCAGLSLAAGAAIFAHHRRKFADLV